MRSDKHNKPISGKLIAIIVGIIAAVAIIGTMAYQIGANNAKKESTPSSSSQSKSSSKTKQTSTATSSSAATSETSTSEATSSEVSNGLLRSLTYQQQQALVAYAVSLSAYIKGQGQPQQFDSRMSEFLANKAGTEATLNYYKGMDAYGRLRPENLMMTMNVKTVGNDDTLLFTDPETGKMSKITLDQIQQDKSIYMDNHNQLSN